MPKYQRFEDLPAWQEAARLYDSVQEFLEQPRVRLSAGFRGQLDRAALSVSNNIAEGFERTGTGELISFLSIAKGSAGEVRSMVAVARRRANLQGVERELQEISERAESCTRQLMAWIGSIEAGRVQGKRYLGGKRKEARDAEKAAREFRVRFLRSLKPEHPLYKSEEARAARGEELEGSKQGRGNSK